MTEEKDPGIAVVEQLLDAFLALDLETAMDCFADDAVLYDPHYPVQRMEGKEAIRQGLAWGIGNLEKPGFTVRHVWSDGKSGAVEMDTHHVFKGGMKLNFDQVFVFETKDGKITRLQSYVPYTPGGLGGFMAKATRWSWKIKGKA
ncbi:MAG: nuclear transport factor 2 family protein [Chloroflexi bacterium]|nr:nuclear transport factor 2 family protein [Chloroflexota bacterium]